MAIDPNILERIIEKERKKLSLRDAPGYAGHLKVNVLGKINEAMV